MKNETVKKVMAEKRRMTIGQLTDKLISGDLRRELGMDKTEFAELVDVMRSTIRRIEGLEATPRMRLIFNTAAALRIGIDFPIIEEKTNR
ncbi:XRE family transcriptional regulator [Salmonella enterica subsp. enterica serovar Braenderup]|uniref:HTH cro/C1-type domain-containing protein n=10 Tax=Salmonella enterica TaxID=28901 RepID=A0A447R486_SALER|nr:helix-turn-helix transcriptional regulator [Salmonella enterica]EAA1177358.1 XRE family transcriptional regulator [Salmonella enterica subsp. enterica serovar Mikawasima]EAA2734152.1 XRE family transcriptional regulator [Salmonella enterica subsp. enterica serovar Reading]EAB7501756.1 XRE family transcriptional regulator [Salmonella enterica subsp. enterica]EAB7888728.1 XRE family transcriptional regulator [Salmonella enterica subsp. enterica serovar Newport]EAC0378395.1 XRE family transcri